MSPALLVGGWTVAAMMQARPFNPVAETVSALAALGATDRWLMTLVFLAVGACDAITGLALRPAAPGRLMLIAGGIAGMMVADSPDRAGGAISHGIWATTGLVALAIWSAGAWRRGPLVPWGLRPATCLCTVAVMLILLAWFGAELLSGTRQAGLAERVVGGTQAAWPFVVVVSCRLSAAHAGQRGRVAAYPS